MKLLRKLVPSLETILVSELVAGNKIREARNDETGNGLTILLQKQYHQDYENDELRKVITTDTHDHGIYYITREKPLQTLIAPHYE